METRNQVVIQIMFCIETEVQHCFTRKRILCYSCLVEEKRKIQGTTERALERTESSVDRTIPFSCQGYGLAGSANSAIEREDQLSDDASQEPRQGPCIAAGTD